MPQASFRSWLGVAKDTINANISATASGTTLTLTNITSTATGTLTTSGASYSVIIVDGVNTETKTCTGNLTGVTAGSTIAVSTLSHTHSPNVYVYFQPTASIGPTAYIPITKIGWTDDYAQLYNESLTGSNVMHPGAVAGMRHGGLSLEGPVFADSFGYLLGSFFGAYDYTATSGSSPTTYAFSPANSSNAQPPKYLFYNFNPGNNNTRVLAQSIVTDMDIKIDPGSLINYTATVQSFASGVVANPATIPPVYSSFGVIPGRAAQVTLGGTVTGQTLTYEATFKRNEAGPIDTLQGIQDPLAVWAGPVELTVKSGYVMNDDSQLLNFYNESQPSFLLTANQAATTAANGITIQTSKANYDPVTVNQTGQGYVSEDVSFTALATSADASTAGGGISPCLVTLSTGTTTGSTLY